MRSLCVSKCAMNQISFRLIATLTTAVYASIVGTLLSHAQYAQVPVSSSAAQLAGGSSSSFGWCDSSRLLRCQQEVIRDIQSTSLNAASVQYPISSGPPYSPKQQMQNLLAQQHHNAAQLNHNPTICRIVRANLDCLLATTPACYDQGIQAAQNTDIMLRAKRFLEQNACNEPDNTWQTTFCYRSPEVRACEDRYGFTTYATPLSPSAVFVHNVSACLAYQAFRGCIDSHLRLNCKVHEMDMINEYMIDRASDLAWRCPTNVSAIGARIIATNPYGDRYVNQRPTYMGHSSSSSLSSYGSLNGARDQQPWERFRNPLDDVVSNNNFGISRFPGSSNGEVFDRLVATANSGFDTDVSDCAQRASPYARECDESLAEHQRLASDSRDANELQRRVCCALFQYRDCISRVVLDRCADSSPTAVEVLMGQRRREMTVTCRGFNRDVCSGAATSVLVNATLGCLLASLLSLFMAKRQEPQVFNAVT